MLTSLLKKLTTSSDDPQQMRRRQYILLGGVVILGVVVYFVIQGSPQTKIPKTLSPNQKELVKMATPYEALNPQDVWFNRIQQEAELAKAEVKAVREENQLLAKKMEIMEQLVQGTVSGKKELKSQSLVTPSMPDTGNFESSANLGPSDLTSPTLPLSPSKMSSGSVTDKSFSDSSTSEDDRLFVTSSPKFLQLSLPEEGRALLKNIDNYVPAGSYARAVLTSGVVASTAIQSSAQPQPIVMRLVEDGHLPQGFRSAMNQNVLIGACYGDLSAERVMCRLETMSWVEAHGVTVEKKIEGWIIGEDGRPGLRGEVVDRSGDAVRDTMIAGLLSGLGQFLRTEATSSVYPVSPFGQTNALTGQRALTGAASNGASNALDKLAEFSIKRAEQMQPVIQIASGRMVDVVFKTGIDIRAEIAKPSLNLITQQSSSKEKTHDPY